MNDRSNALFLTVLLGCLVSVSLFAGEQFEKDGAAIGGYDPVAYFTDMKPVKGSREFHAVYKVRRFTIRQRPTAIGWPPTWPSLPRSMAAIAPSAR